MWRITFTWPSSYDDKDIDPLHMMADDGQLEDSIAEILDTFVGSRILSVTRP